jgi:hypothetical protein
VLTVPALTVKAAEVAPWGIVTLEATLAAEVLELESETTTPPVPAPTVRLTVPVPVWPFTIVVGLTETPLRAVCGGVIVTPAVAAKPE